jgi:transcription-repair coupling factor (superfamily II helicase)
MDRLEELEARVAELERRLDERDRRDAEIATRVEAILSESRIDKARVELGGYNAMVKAKTAEWEDCIKKYEADWRAKFGRVDGNDGEGNQGSM